MQPRSTAATEESDMQPPKRSLRELRRLGGFLRPYRLAIAGAGLALTVAAGTVLVIGQGLRRLVDDGFAAGNIALLDNALVALLVIVVVLAGATYSRFYLVSWIGERVMADLRKAVFQHTLRLDPAFYETMRIGEVMSRLTADTTLIQAVVGTSASMALRNVLLVLGGMAMLAITSPRLTLLVMLVVPLILVPILVFGRQVRRLSRESLDRLADVSAYVDESIANIRTVQAFGHETLDRARFSDRVEETFATSVRRIRARALLTAIVILLIFGAIGVILWIGGRDVISGRLSAGDLSAFVFYAVIVASSVGAISEVIGELQRAAGATERLFELMDIEPKIVPPDRPRSLPKRAEARVSVEGVTFRYPSRPDDAALTEFSLDVAPGETVALVGPSGAGKTTVFQLLLRFYDPDAGRLSLDGTDLRDLDPAELRHHVGLVPQEPVIFSADAWENIRYGRPGASDEDVRAAADAASASSFIDALPDGFDTFLGEKGVRLSGGQRQRIAIARAILRDPELLLLDEATSALDAESERAVQTALTGLMQDRTTLVIAHRLATVTAADRIVVLDEGRIVAEGTHQELIHKGGLYARLAELQFDLDGASATAQ
ncbi:MAG: ABC transporter [Alphaproteobacteria bacterium]|nr:ABC transporter [Alphaproteobacteria bacterium]